MPGERAAVHEDLAELQFLVTHALDQLDVVGDAAVRRQDADLRVVLHEFERAFDRRLVGITAVRDFETDVAVLRVHRVGGGDLVEQGDDADQFAEGAEIANEGHRVHAVL